MDGRSRLTTCWWNIIITNGSKSLTVHKLYGWFRIPWVSPNTHRCIRICWFCLPQAGRGVDGICNAWSWEFQDLRWVFSESGGSHYPGHVCSLIVISPHGHVAWSRNATLGYHQFQQGRVHYEDRFPGLDQASSRYPSQNNLRLDKNALHMRSRVICTMYIAGCPKLPASRGFQYDLTSVWFGSFRFRIPYSMLICQTAPTSASDSLLSAQLTWKSFVVQLPG